jgi:alpha/beta superfamily hydrolase
MELFIPGPVGRLEAILWLPKESGDSSTPRAAAIVCHPHPLAGGTMHNNVVFRIARGLQSAGLAVLRFNFRGAGASEGAHDGQGGEEEDARAALDHLAREFPGVALWAAGFSFGSRTLASLARREPRIERLLLVALPVRAYDCAFITQVRAPVHLLMSSNDQYGSFADLRERFASLPPNITVDEIPAVDHFFRGQTPEVERRVRAWAEQQLTIR